MIKTGYKLVRESRKSGHVKTLFRPVQGIGRDLPRRRWIRADRLWGCEGGSRRYWTGFHLLPSQAMIEPYLRRFKRPEEIRVVEVRYRGGNKKPGRTPVWLAREIIFV